jgi:hypothetical protein
MGECECECECQCECECECEYKCDFECESEREYECERTRERERECECADVGEEATVAPALLASACVSEDLLEFGFGFLSLLSQFSTQHRLLQ